MYVQVYSSVRIGPDTNVEVALIAEYYQILVELPNTTYKVPNANI